MLIKQNDYISKSNNCFVRSTNDFDSILRIRRAQDTVLFVLLKNICSRVLLFSTVGDRDGGPLAPVLTLIPAFKRAGRIF